MDVHEEHFEREKNSNFQKLFQNFNNFNNNTLGTLFIYWNTSVDAAPEGIMAIHLYI
jgi:hypothetical protein